MEWLWLNIYKLLSGASAGRPGPGAGQGWGANDGWLGLGLQDETGPALRPGLIIGSLALPLPQGPGLASKQPPRSQLC